MDICVICAGNICRSPFAEHVLKRELCPKHTVFSAGLLGIYGSLAYEVCITLAPRYRIDLTPHRSQGITPAVLKADLLLCMSQQQKTMLEKQYDLAPEKVRLLSEYLPENRTFDLGRLGNVKRGDTIPDPVGGSETLVKPVLDVIEIACIEIAQSISGG